MSDLDDLSGSGAINTTAPESPTNCSNPFNDPIYAKVAAVAAASGSISFLASCFVIFIIVLFKKWRFFTQRLILYLAISAALESLATILQRTDYDNVDTTHYNNFCIFAGFLGQVTGWMVLNSVISITVSLLLTAFTNKQAGRFEIVYTLLIFVFPLTINWIPFINSSYGRAGAWCWIRSETCQKLEFGWVLQLVLWYIPLYVIMFILIILYVIVLVKLHRTKRRWTGTFEPRRKKTQELMAQEMLPLIAYPLVFFLLNITPFINRIHGAADPQNPNIVLWFISAALFPLQGGVIAIAFCLDPETRKRLNLANFKSAFMTFGKNKVVKEYNFPGNEEREKSQTQEKGEEAFFAGREAETKSTDEEPR